MPPSDTDWFNLPDDYQLRAHLSEQGWVTRVGDGIIWVEGLPGAMMDEVLVLDEGSRALVVLLDAERIGAIVLHQATGLASGAAVRRSGRRLDIAVGEALLGRVVDAQGRVLDGGEQPELPDRALLERPSPAILDRDFVRRPLYTGNRIVDNLIPIGKGQRQLLVGDSGLGKTALAIDTIVRQAADNVICIYVAIGQTRSSIASIMDTLERTGALAYTVLVVAEANELAGGRYLAPFAGCAIAEHWMQQGRDALIVYDDLTQHAQAYRELSLLLHRPPGREAYPGDIFYLHSRLLERSTVLAQAGGGGSITALPVVETKQGEISSYIPTNLISITDGQIYFDQKLFAAGMLPAIDVTRSVSRIGGKAQHPAIKKEAGRIRLDYLQFLELEAFTRFGTKLEAAMEAKLRRGRLLRAIFKQERLQPLSARAQLAWLLAYNEQYLDDRVLETIPALLQALATAADDSELTLDHPRDDWLVCVRRGLEGA